MSPEEFISFRKDVEALGFYQYKSQLPDSIVEMTK
jgi:hypothetical protein